MNAAAARAIDRDHVVADDPRNAVLELFTSTLEGAASFAKVHDCELQLREIVNRVVPAPASSADLFGNPVAREQTAIPEISDLQLAMVSGAYARVAKLKMSAAEHSAFSLMKQVADAIIAARKQARKA